MAMDLDTLVLGEVKKSKDIKDGDEINIDCLLKEGTVTAEDIRCIIADIASNPKEVRELLAILGIENDQLEHDDSIDEADGAAISSCIFKKLADKELSYEGLAAALDNSSLKRTDLVAKHCLIDQGVIPKSILARGKRALEAYRSALKKGKTYDKRVKVLLIGQDRAGKTSVAKALRGELLCEDEPQTVGVKMDEPLKNATEEDPWRYSRRKSSAFEDKCVKIMHQDLMKEPQRSGESKQTDLCCSLTDSQHVSRHSITPSSLQVTGSDEVEAVPDNIASLLEESLEADEVVPSDGIWPLIGELGGQIVHRALHPIFMTSEALYLLVFDLSKNVYANAGKDNVCGLDNILRSMDTVHSLKQSIEGETFPPVILVGTHADCIKPDDPDKKMECLLERFCENSLIKEHVLGNVVLNNTLAGHGPGKEDPEIVRLRKMILREAEKMPHTKKEIPLHWLYVESKIEEEARVGKKFVPRGKFYQDIVEKVCTLEGEEETEQLLQYLHDRGTVVYYIHPENSDGLVVLDPQWLVNVFHQILNVVPSKEDSMKIRNCRKELRKRGTLRAELLNHVCKRLNVHEIQQSLIFIMEKFNLLCRINSKDQVYLVPCLLAPKPEDKWMLPKSRDENSSPALYLTFKTDFVPAGLFPKLVSLLRSWAASKTSCEQQQIFSNAACFVLDDTNFLQIICNKSVVKLNICSQGDSYEDLGCYSEVYSSLERCLAIIRVECHWLRAVSWEISVRCPLCAGKLGPHEGLCTWHGTQGCLHDDCAHYMSLKTHRPYHCPFANKFIPEETFTKWLNVMENNNIRQNAIPTVQQTLASCNQDRSKVQVILLSPEWGSSKGGLPTINRLLAIELAKHRELEVSLYVSKWSEDDERLAKSHGITIIKAQKHPGYEPLDCLAFRPDETFWIDVVIGHGTKLGKQAQFIKQLYPKCVWIQFAHTAPEELAMHKNYCRNISIGEDKHKTEVQLMAMADLAAAVGPKLAEDFQRYLRPYQEKRVFEIVPSPSIFQEFDKCKQVKEDREKFHVLVFGRGDVEDFLLKGYDIASKAISELKDPRYHLCFVGAAKGEMETVAQNLLRHGISKSQLTVRGFESREELARQLVEVDLAIMPSRTEGFGLAALEALSGGLPILVGGNSGFAEALKKINNHLASSCVVDSEDAKDWAAAIQAIKEKPRPQRLQDAQTLKVCFEKHFSWPKKCKSLVKQVLSMVKGKMDGDENRSSLDEFLDQPSSTHPNNEYHCDQKATEHVFKDGPDLQVAAKFSCLLTKEKDEERLVENELQRTQPGFRVTNTV